jgi:hypothetical protein
MGKTCGVCEQTKSVSEFYAQVSRKDGLQAYCKDCNKQHIRARHQAQVAQHGRKCVRCKERKPLEAFGLVGDDRRRICNPCEIRNPEHMCKRAQLVRMRKPERAVLRDCRASDRKKGRPRGDLDLDFVREQLARGCQYCGEVKMRITLDRIDNGSGHTRANVVPACLRCNYLRGSMPYRAWLNLVPSVRATRELGLFGDWRSQPFNRKAA